MLTLIDELKDVRERTDKVLNALLPVPDGTEKPVVEAMRYATIGGGKALRPFLVMTTAGMFDVSKDDCVRIAVAAEMVHSYSLIHDDLPCMDNDDMRRGKPSCHKAFGQATAVLAGDGLLTRAFDILSSEQTPFDAVTRCALVNALARAAGFQGMVAGQMMDLAAETAIEPLPLTEILRLQALKTGRMLTFCCEAGALVGKAPFAQLQTLRAYAADIGLAFQMTDDLLDENGDAQKVGKTLHKDANKATYLSVVGQSKTRAKVKELIAHSLETLVPFGDKALLLKELSLFILNRNH